MKASKYNILLADDDADDRTFFEDALEELALPAELSTVNDGVQLMKTLTATQKDLLPDVLFLDLNMPLKSGFECLTEIKSTETLKYLPIIIFSTSLDTTTVDKLYAQGATYYICKPGDFSKLKKVIFDAITLADQNKLNQPTRDSFVLQP